MNLEFILDSHAASFEGGEEASKSPDNYFVVESAVIYKDPGLLGQSGEGWNLAHLSTLR